MDITSLLLPLLLVLMFGAVILSGRKQRRQVQEMQALQKAVETGDVVMTTCGLRGTVVDASYEETVDLEIADGVVTTWVRAAIKNKVVEPATPTAVDTDEPVDEPAGPVDAQRTPELADVPDSPSLDKSVPMDSVPMEKESLPKGDSANGTPRP